MQWFQNCVAQFEKPRSKKMLKIAQVTLDKLSICTGILLKHGKIFRIGTKASTCMKTAIFERYENLNYIVF